MDVKCARIARLAPLLERNSTIFDNFNDYCVLAGRLLCPEGGEYADLEIRALPGWELFLTVPTGPLQGSFL